MKHMALGRRRGERGSAVIVALTASLGIVAAGTAMSVVSIATQKDNESARMRTERRLVAEAGLSLACQSLIAGGTGNLGSASAPVKWGAGSYVTTAVRNTDGTHTVTAQGKVGSRSRTIRAILRERRNSPFYGAIYAGNASGSTSYSLSLGGTGTRADTVSGDVYSGGNLSVSGDATISGSASAAGTVTGVPGDSGVAEPAPDLVGAHYEATHDVNVASEFAAYGTSASNSALGGTAYQVPETNPAHIFRRNPSDRSSQTSATTKDDYFLEDPYESVDGSNSTSPSHSTRVTLSGVSGEPGTSSNRKVFFIDGNLWVHNLKLYSFVFHHAETAGVQVTLVVKGNIYISDNIVLKDAAKDGVALIAVKDSSVTDSGNIYFGDPVYGTLEEMDAYMYAEGNFYDNNLGTSGSSQIVVNGMMSAADQVSINHGSGNTRTKLVLTFDTRVRDGTLDLPGLPQVLLGNAKRTFDWLTQFEVGGGD